MSTTSESYRYIVRSPDIRGGNARVEDTRIAVHDVIGLLQNGETVDTLTMNCFPALSKAQIYECTIAPKAVVRFKEKIREITRRAKGVSIETTIATLAPYMRGWRGYFGFCETPSLLIQLTRWVRRRLRAALWRQWKTQRRRRTMLIQLGVRGQLADNTAGSGLGPWHLAHSKALNIALSNTYFRKHGLPSLFESC